MDINVFNDYKQNKETYSQLGQDLLVAWVLNEKQNGYFVDFGATDGVGLSNTYLLEKNYGWNGIACEPGHSYQEDLHVNRNCHIDSDCVYTTTGRQVEFLDTDLKGLSTISMYASSDMHAQLREAGVRYNVTTVTLDDLLDRYDAPEVIDYMSIDTEGSELDILLSYSFSRHINMMTVEHNHTDKRQLIHDLLVAKGFHRVFESLSDFDDWYINDNIR